MALLTVAGESGCPTEEVARLAAQRLQFELFTESGLRALIREQFADENTIPDKAYPPVLASVLARLAAKSHLVACVPGTAFILREYAGAFRVRLVAPPAHRAGTLMIEERIEHTAALERLKELDKEQASTRKKRFGRATVPPYLFDITLNSAAADTDTLAGTLAAAVESQRLRDHGLLAPEAEADIQFRVRLQLARYSIRPPGEVDIKRKTFVHPSEEVFANLLDFYRIAWEYEPRTFELSHDSNGNLTEAFTPDFYLPEYDLYVELTTMKQSLVTRKNRKVRRLREQYPGINIQVFYQKDFQNLIFKYGLTDRTVRP